MMAKERYNVIVAYLRRLAMIVPRKMAGHAKKQPRA